MTEQSDIFIVTNVRRNGYDNVVSHIHVLDNGHAALDAVLEAIRPYSKNVSYLGENDGNNIHTADPRNCWSCCRGCSRPHVLSTRYRSGICCVVGQNEQHSRDARGISQGFRRHAVSVFHKYCPQQVRHQSCCCHGC